MSRQKLSIIVTCSDRKAATPSADLMARNLPQDTVDVRVRAWSRALTTAPASTQLDALYRGDSWSQAKRLMRTARELGYDPDLLVASAGLGLRSASDVGPAYSATFSMGQDDSVASSVSEAKRWWSDLPHTRRALPSTAAIWVLSDSYSRVIADDLLARASGDRLLIFGGSADLPPGFRVSADRSLRRALGGTATSLNVRMAIKWLELAVHEDLTSTAAREAWMQWSARERYHEQFSRRPLSDRDVRDFVAALYEREPGISRTRALRSLRDSGLACEQRRFAALYAQVVTP